MFNFPPPTGQKKNPGEHCNEKEADRGGEIETPVHKGAFHCNNSKRKCTRFDVSRCGCNLLFHLSTLQCRNVSPAVTKQRL